MGSLLKIRSWVAEQRICHLAKRFLRGPEVSQVKIASFLQRYKTQPLPMRRPELEASLAIVVPCYNHAGYLEKMFSSITSQTRPPEEVIFVEDNAQDRSKEILQELIGSYHGSTRFSLLHNEHNLGQAASLNRGIDAATAGLIMVLNDDDYLFPYAVEAMVALFGAHGDLFMIGGTSVHFEGDAGLEAALSRAGLRDCLEAVRLTRRDPKEVSSYRYYNDLNMTNSGCCFLKSAWETVGGYYPVKNQRVVPFSDRDFQLRVNALFPVAVSPNVPFSLWRSNSSVDCGINS